jgi:uncharacterized protein involved in outer membrane biogenesis
MKKFLIIFASVLVVLVVAIAVIPLFVSVDEFRPTIQKQLDAKFRGKVVLGKLSLRTFPSLKVKVDGVQVVAPAPFDKEKLADIRELEVSLPLYSILFAPRLSILISEPQIRLVESGKTSNLAEFLPAPTTEAPAAPESPAAEGGDPLSSVPGILRGPVQAAKINLVLDNAFLSLYKLGAEAKEHTTVKNLNFKFSDIGFRSPMDLQLSTEVDYKSPTLTAQGPLSAQGKITVTPEADAVYLVDFNLENDLSPLAIRMGQLFAKDAKTALKLQLEGQVKKYADLDAKLEKFLFKFGDLEIVSRLQVARAKSEDGQIDFAVNSSNLDLSQLDDFVPMVKQYSLKGNFSLGGTAKGLLKAPTLDLALSLANVSGKTPQLAIPLKDLDGKIAITGTSENPTVAINPLNIKIGSSDMGIQGLIQGIAAPNVKFTISSNRFNVDEMLGTQSSAAAAAQGSGSGAPGEAPPESAANTAPLDETLNQMAPELEKSLANPMLDKLRADIKINAKSMRVIQGEFKNARLQLGYVPRTLTISKTGIEGYKGSFVLDGKFGLNPKLPTFDLSSKLQGISIGEALKVHMPGWKDELSGNINGQFSISGKGLRTAQLNENLRGGLSGEVKNGRTSIPVVKLISGVLEKLPKKVQNPAADKAKGQSFNGEFKTMQLQTSIVGRTIKIDKTDIAFATEQAGLGEVKFLGNGTVNFDRQLDFVGTAFMSPQVVPLKELKGPSGQVEIPLKFKGLMNSPSPDIGYSVGILGPRMLKNFAQSESGQKVINKATDELKKQLDKQNIPEPAKKALDDLKKKFKF